MEISVYHWLIIDEFGHFGCFCWGAVDTCHKIWDKKVRWGNMERVVTWNEVSSGFFHEKGCCLPLWMCPPPSSVCRGQSTLVTQRWSRGYMERVYVVSNFTLSVILRQTFHLLTTRRDSRSRMNTLTLPQNHQRPSMQYIYNKYTVAILGEFLRFLEALYSRLNVQFWFARTCGERNT